MIDYDAEKPDEWYEQNFEYETQHQEIIARDANLGVIHGILKESFQALSLVGFDLEGRCVHLIDYETPLQRAAITEAIRDVVRNDLPHPVVHIDNESFIEPDED